jgi:hypothetical protein
MGEAGSRNSDPKNFKSRMNGILAPPEGSPKKVFGHPSIAALPFRKAELPRVSPVEGNVFAHSKRNHNKRSLNENRSTNRPFLTESENRHCNTEKVYRAEISVNVCKITVF